MSSENTIVYHGMIYEPAVLSWPAATTELGPVEDFSCEIPADTSGILIVWQVPVCDSCPNGYFISLNESEWNISMPGCLSTEMLELCRIQCNGLTMNDDDDESNKNDRPKQDNQIIDQCPDISINLDALNPKPKAEVNLSSKSAKK